MDGFKRIPRQVFLYWGITPMPWLVAQTFITLKRHNPDWIINLCAVDQGRICSPTWQTHENRDAYAGRDYTGMAMQAVDYIHHVNLPDFMGAAVPDVYAADYCRIHVLAHYGGMWCDTDVWWLKPVEEIPCKRDASNVITWTQHARPSSGHYSMGVVLAEPGLPFYVDMIHAMPREMRPGTYQGFGPDLWKRVHPLPPPDAVRLPYHVFYPFHYNDIGKFWDGRPVHPETVAVHWFGGAMDTKPVKAHFTHLNRFQPNVAQGATA